MHVGKENDKGKEKLSLSEDALISASGLSKTRRPLHMTVTEWQTALRKQMAEKSEFEITNTGTGGAYSDYTVYNPVTRSKYKVAIRSRDNSLNYCSCYDFKTNQLGTCKHIEAILRKIDNDPILKELISEPYTPAYSSMYMEYRGERKIMFRIGTENSDEISSLLKPYLKPDGSLNKIGYASIDKILAKAFQINPGFRCYEDALEHIITVRERKHRELFLQPFIEKNKLPPLKTLTAHPFQYQIQGILFCAMAGRSILGDEMGLGKTVQAIGVAQLMHEHFRVDKVLVICPATLKYQWQGEIEKFCTSGVQIIEGNHQQRKSSYNDENKLYKVVSYSTAIIDADLINTYQPDLIILDEAQRINNWQTKVSRGIKKLNSKFALVLTGTPIEKKLEELYSLVQFINPLMLGSLYHFTSSYEKTDEDGKVIGYKDLHSIAEKLSSILIRRTKNDVKTQLPLRLDKNLFVDITPEQKKLHQTYSAEVSKLVKRWKKLGYLTEFERQRMMITLKQMRMVCNSSFLTDQQTPHQTKMDELMNIIDQLIHSGEEKVVIFSQWEKYTRQIAQELDKSNIGFVNLNSSVPSDKVKELFDRFNRDSECRIFLSTDEGGAGLNLQTASFLINMDQPWDPAVLQQRIARIYRQGQKKPVNIINLIARHTIEHQIHELLLSDPSVFNGIPDQGESNIFISDDQFSQFMKAIEKIMTGQNEIPDQEEYVTIREPEITAEERNRKVVQGALFEADGEEEDNQMDSQQAKVIALQPHSELLATTATFLARLSEVLSNRESTEKLVKEITRKDESTGQTYLQIPVTDEKTIELAINLLSGIFGRLDISGNKR